MEHIFCPSFFEITPLVKANNFLLVDAEIIFLLSHPKFHFKQDTKQLVLLLFSFESVRQQKRKNDAFRRNFAKQKGKLNQKFFSSENVLSGRHVEQTAASHVNHSRESGRRSEPLYRPWSLGGGICPRSDFCDISEKKLFK